MVLSSNEPLREEASVHERRDGAIELAHAGAPAFDSGSDLQSDGFEPPSRDDTCIPNSAPDTTARAQARVAAAPDLLPTVIIGTRLLWPGLQRNIRTPAPPRNRAWRRLATERTMGEERALIAGAGGRLGACTPQFRPSWTPIN